MNEKKQFITACLEWARKQGPSERMANYIRWAVVRVAEL